MALEIAYYIVERSVAERSGLIGERYVTKDGRFLLDNKDLSRIRLTAEEFVSGLSGIEKIDPKDRETVIAEGGYNMDADKVVKEEQV